MIYLKSFLVGIFAVVVYLIVWLTRIWFFVLRPQIHEGEGMVVSADIFRPAFLVGAVIVFAAVCYWTYRRSSKKA
jgi:hypothetical protein